LQLNQVEIAEGALESLAVLWFAYCPELKSLPDGIEYLTSLEELCFQDTAEELIHNFRQERDTNHCNKELMKISHVRKVIVALTNRNIWERIH
jgi:disease resistance protein RPM1